MTLRLRDSLEKLSTEVLKHRDAWHQKFRRRLHGREVWEEERGEADTLSDHSPDSMDTSREDVMRVLERTCWWTR